MVRTGAFGYLQYGYEASCAFGDICCTDCLTLDIPFGLEQRITNWNFTNNRITLAALNQVEPAIYAYGTTRGSLAVDFVLSNPWWLGTVFDNRATADGSACMETDHVYTISSKIRNTIALEIGASTAGTVMCPTGITRRLVGGVVNSIALRSAIGEPVRASVDISYTNEVEAANCLDACPGTDTCNFPYTFAYGNLTSSAGTIAEIQSFDININQNSDLLYGHNSSVAVDAYRRLFEITGSFTASYLDTELLRDIYAQAHCMSGAGIDGTTFAREQCTITLTFNNGQTCMNTERSITLVGTGLGFADHAVPIEPNEPIFETLNWQVRTMTVTASNATLCAAVPGAAP